MGWQIGWFHYGIPRCELNVSALVIIVTSVTFHLTSRGARVLHSSSVISWFLPWIPVNFLSMQSDTVPPFLLPQLSMSPLLSSVVNGTLPLVP